MMSTIVQRRLPVGAEVGPDGTHFRVWAPRRAQVEVILDGRRTFLLRPETNGYFSGVDGQADAGTLYQFRLDNADRLYPDPASRFQPEGPHGPSQVVDPSAFTWTDYGWRGISMAGQILYELHVGTFTREGTWRGARERLSKLASLGVTTLEIMPIATFPGRFGWGYDGVDLYAPIALYGSPDDFRRFIDRAHSLGLGVILDVVYNHLGPDGNYLKEFSPLYFTDRYINEWGEPINFDGPDSAPVREFFVANARYWIEEFHLDGLRLDATQQIFDASPVHIIKEIAQAAREAAGQRKIILVAENEPQWSELVKPIKENGLGLDSIWNDDFHHTARVASSGRTEAYFTDYRGSAQEFVSALKWGFLYQGQYYEWQKKRRGTPAFDLTPQSFVHYLQNHDQVANSFCGMRLHQYTTPSMCRALTAILLLSPQTPLIFQGQEFGASSRFAYFADHNPDLAPRVQHGRESFLRQFPSIAESQMIIPLAAAYQTFEDSKLDHAECTDDNKLFLLHRDLIQLRKRDAVFRAQRTDWLQGATLTREAFVLRFFGQHAGDRLIIVNLGHDLEFSPAPEPLLAEPRDSRWSVIWNSESPDYGGCGRNPLDELGIWRLTAQSTVVFSSIPRGRDI